MRQRFLLTILISALHFSAFSQHSNCYSAYTVNPNTLVSINLVSGENWIDVGQLDSTFVLIISLPNDTGMIYFDSIVKLAGGRTGLTTIENSGSVFGYGTYAIRISQARFIKLKTQASSLVNLYASSMPPCSCITIPPNCELICNGSFEEYSNLPTSNNHLIDLACPWEGLTSPDYFNASGFTNIVHANPNYNGSGGAGAWMSLSSSSGGPLYRENFYQELQSPIPPDGIVYAEFSAALGNTRYAMKEIGMHFDNGVGYNYSTYIGLQQHLYSSTPITSTNLSTVSGLVQNNTLTDWNYAHLGNFLDNTIPGNVIYNSAATYSGSYYLFDDISVVRLPDAGDDKSICLGQSVTLGRIDCPSYPTGVTFSWYDPNGTPLGSTPTISVNPTTTTTYSLVISYNGHSITDYVTVTVGNPQITIGSVSSMPLCDVGPFSFYVLNPIAGFNYTWYDQNSNLISTGTPSLVSLYLNNITSVQVYATDGNGCDAWSNIIQIDKCCFYDDQSAINYFGTVYSSSIPAVSPNDIIVIHDKLVIDNFFFVDNAHIYMDDYTKIEISSSGTFVLQNSEIESCDTEVWEGIELLATTSSMTMDNSIIKDARRAISIDKSSAVYFDNSNTFENNVIGIELRDQDFSYLTIDGLHFETVGNLKNPYSQDKGHIGINLDNVTQISIGSTSNPLDNSFKNLRFGVKSSLSGQVEIINNKFDDILADNYSKSNPYEGSAIYIGGNKSQQGKALIGGSGNEVNYFYNCDNGIVSFLCDEVNCEKNEFQEINRFGIYVSKSFGGNINILKNNFDYSDRCVYVTDNFSPSVLIEYNVLQNPKSNKNIGIFSGQSTSSLSGDCDIRHNYILDFDKGIQCVNLKNLKIRFNNIEDLRADFYQLNFGIAVQDCYKPTIHENSVDGTSANIYSLRGISIEGSTSNYTYWNCVQDVGRAYYFGGASPNSDFVNNQMSNARTGIYCNYAVLGIVNQSINTAGDPMNNRWFGNFVHHIYSNNTSKSTTNFWMPMQSVADPAAHPSPFFFGFDNSSSGTPPAGRTFLPWDLNYQYGCINSLVPPTRGSQSILDDHEIAIMADTTSLMPYTSNVAAMAWLRDQALYSHLIRDTLTNSNDSILLAFVNARSMEEIGEIENIEEYINEGIDNGYYGDFSVAMYLTDLLPNISHFPVITTKEYNTHYLQIRLENDTSNFISGAALGSLESIAAKCPYFFGRKVYAARVLLAQQDTNWIGYYSDCELMYTGGMNKLDSHENESEILAYPNPGKGELVISDETNLEIEGISVVSLEGREILFEIERLSEREIKLTLINASTGVYFIILDQKIGRKAFKCILE